MVPVFGEVADLVNAGIYAAEGNYLDASLSMAGMVPFAGMAVTGARMVKNTVKTVNKALDVANVASDAFRVADGIPLNAATPPIATLGKLPEVPTVKLPDMPTVKAPDVPKATVIPAPPVVAQLQAPTAVADSGRGLNSAGGIVSEQGTNAAGGRIVTSTGPISQNDFAGFVDTGLMRGDDVHILTGVHGAPDGSMLADATLSDADVARFGDYPGVTVHDVPSMAPEAIHDLLEAPGTIIGGFCDSAACLAPFK